jgi:hypothetical protein
MITNVERMRIVNLVRIQLAGGLWLKRGA